ncbi:unnamed protein product, partial [marine sediment metagenome]
EIIEQTVEAIEEYKDTEFLPMIINTLHKAKIGIGNLSTTYDAQPAVTSRINVIIANINHQLKKHKGCLEPKKRNSSIKKLDM